MPSLARMLALMLVFAGPLGLPAQTFPPRGPSYGSSYGPSSAPSSAQPGRMPTSPDSGWPNPTNTSVPAAASMQPGPYSSQVVPVSAQAPADSFGQTPGNTPGTSAVGFPASENRAPRVMTPGNLLPTNIHGSTGTASPSASVAPVSLSPPGRSAGVPLSPPGRSGRNATDAPTGVTSLVTAGGSLALVLGIFFLVAWGMRRARPAGMTALPGEVFEVLGRAPMANRQQVHLLRCGSKLLLVCVTPTGTETLTEIVDPMEVDRLAGLCRQTHPGSATEAFRQVFRQFAPQQPDSRPLSRIFGNGNREDASFDGLDMPRTPSELGDRNV